MLDLYIDKYQIANYIYLMSENYYPVEQIIGKKYVKNKVIYKVKWQGFPIQQSTWEKASRLKNVSDLVEKYEKQLLEQNSHTSSNSNFERTSKGLEQSSKNVRSNLRSSQSKKRLNASLVQENVSKTIMRPKINLSLSDTNVMNVSVNEEVDQNTRNTIDSKKAVNTIEKMVDNLKPKKKKKRKEKTSKINHSTQEKQGLYESQGYISQRLYQNLQQKQDLSRCSFETPAFNNSYSSRKEQVSPHKNDEPAQNIFKETTQREEKPSQITHINNGNKTSEEKLVREAQNLTPTKNIASNPQGVQVAEKDKEDKKSVQTISSQSSCCKSIHERLHLKSEDVRVGNIKIRLLENDDDEKDDIKDYLVQYEDGSLKILSSIQLIIQHTLEFIFYLQGKAYSKKK